MRISEDDLGVVFVKEATKNSACRLNCSAAAAAPTATTCAAWACPALRFPPVWIKSTLPKNA